MSSNKKITMEDIAQMAGVSRATVSRALRDSSLVNEGTRKRVKELAQKYNFAPNIAARNFRTRKTFTIAVVIMVDAKWGHELSNAFLMALLGSIADEASHTGYDLLLATHHKEIDDLYGYYIEGRRADGLIIIGQGREDERLTILAEKQAPFIVWGAPVLKQPYPVVGSDNIQGAKVAVKSLIKQGRKRVAFMGNTLHPEVYDRYKGYKQALEDTNLPYDPNLYIVTDFSQEDGYQQCDQKLIGADVEFDAIFAASDSIALGALKKLKEIDYSVPDKIALIGFDDSPISLYCDPALTTVRQNVKLAGEYLIRNLLRILNKEQIDDQIIMTELIERGTTMS